MDRLVKADVQEMKLLFIRGQPCCATFKLTNLMHTMHVATSLTSTNPSVFSFSHPISTLPPLSSSTFTLYVHTPSSNTPPLSAPHDAVLVRSSMLPTGGNPHREDLRRLFSRPGSHIFKDATIPVSFVGPHVVESLFSYKSNCLLVKSLFPEAIAWCDKSQKNSLLKIAAREGDAGFVVALIDARADVNDRSGDGKSAMTHAVRSGRAEVVKVLIDSGYINDEKRDRFLHDAAMINREDILELILLGYRDIDVDSVEGEGRTALHTAAVKGYVGVLEYLLAVGCDPDIVDGRGWSPLHYAASQGDSDAVRVLSARSVFGKHALTREGKTPFALAVDQGHEELYDVLHFDEVLLRAARVGDVCGVRNCVTRGGNVNCKDQNGWTPLHRAAFKGHVECVKALVSHGGEVNVVDGEGYTPLHLAIEGGHSSVAVHLISHGGGREGSVKSLKENVHVDWNALRRHLLVLKPFCQ